MTLLLSSPASWTVPGRRAVPEPLRAVSRYESTVDGDLVRVRAQVDVGRDPETLRGHFPGLPIYPGVYIVESVIQAVDAALAPDRPLRLETVRSVRFTAPLSAGDRLDLDIEVRPGTGEIRARGQRPDGTRVADLRATLGAYPDRDAPPPPPEGTRPDTPPESVPMPWSRVRELLPQRHPLLLVDRVPAIVPGRSVRAEKAVTGTEPCYRDVDARDGLSDAYPATLILESIGQTAALAWLSGSGPVTGDQVLMFVVARGFRVLGEARPGDVLHHVVELTSVKADTAFATGETWVGDRRIATCDEIIAVCRPRVMRSGHGDPDQPTTPEEADR